MSGQTVSSAVAVQQRQEQLVAWIRTQQDEIAMVAASHVKPSAIIRVAHGALRRNEKLMAAAIANPQSLMYALLDCARLGHEPDTDDYYLAVFGSEVTGLEGYKGVIERMYRAGGVSSVVAEVVRQGDVYRRTGPTSPPVHEFDEFADPADRGPLRGAYAYAVMLDGRHSKVIAMGRAEIMKHKAKNRGSEKADSPWQQWEEPMWKKCPLHGLEPYVPTSTEYRAAVAAAPPAREVTDGRAWAPARPAAAPGAGVVLQAVKEPSASAPEVTRPAAREASQGRQASRGPSRPTEAAAEKLAELLQQVPLGPPQAAADWLAWVTGHPVTEDLTAADCAAATRSLTAALKASGGNGELAAAAIWTAYNEGRPEAAGAESAAAPAPEAPARPTGAAIGRLGKLLTPVPLGKKEQVSDYLEWVTGHPALEELTSDDVAAATKHLTDALNEAHGNPELAAGAIWTAWQAAHPETAGGADSQPDGVLSEPPAAPS